MFLESLRSDVDRLMTSSLEQTMAAVEPVGGAARELIEPLRSLAAKGKRLRPAFLMAAFAGQGGQSESAAYNAALHVCTALELFQVAALVHDDILDNSDTRRGMPATHRSIEAKHRALGLSGDSPTFGLHGAILAGDLALMASSQQLAFAVSMLDGDHGADVTSRFSRMSSLCTAGQYLDIRLAATPWADLGGQHNDIEAVMRSKTASYTTEGPLVLGACLAGASADALDEWSRAAVPLGLAFQLRDDLLGTVGSAATTGKPAGDDLKEGKRTLVVSAAWERASAAQRKLLSDVLGVADAGQDAIDAAIQVLHDTGAVDHAEHAVAAYYAQWSSGLDQLSLEPSHAAVLVSLADAAVNRAF